LGELAKWKTFREGAANPKRLAELGRRDRLAAHDLKEAIAPLEDSARTRHPILCELQ
jgi:hypothetical protein